MTSNSLQLIVTNEAILQEVTFNYDQLKSSLAERLSKYRDTVVTEDAINAAKQDRANLNKLESALKDKQQEIERRLLGDFGVKLRELRSMVTEASKSIDAQVKYFEQQVKDQKKSEIKAIYDDHIGDLTELLPFDRLFDVTWLNKTAAMKKVEAELIGKIETARNDLAVIDQLQVAENIAVAVKDHFLRTLNLSSALTEKARLEKAASDMLERKKRQEELRRQEEEYRKHEEEAYKAAVSMATPSDAVVSHPEPIPTPETPPLQQIDFRVWVTPEQKQGLVDYIKSNGIRYGKVTD